MKKPEVRVLPYKSTENELTGIYIVEINGVKTYRCIGKKDAEVIPDMIDALSMVWLELESKEDWGEDLSPSQIHQIHKALEKAGVEI